MDAKYQELDNRKWSLMRCAQNLIKTVNRVEGPRTLYKDVGTKPKNRGQMDGDMDFA